ncbi:MAG: serine hydrolase [bacterium]
MPAPILKKVVFFVAAALLVGCSPSVTSTPPTTAPSPGASSISPLPSTPALSPTFYPLPSRSSTPNTVLYEKAPEQAGGGWEVASLAEAGIDPCPIEKMLQSIYKGRESGDTPTLPNGSPKYQNIHGILIVKDGRLVFEEYFYNFTRKTNHDLASVSKSFTSLLVGLAIEQGYLTSVQEKILPHFPDYLPVLEQDARKESIAIEHLLTMQSGMDCDDWDPASRTYYLNAQPDQADEIKSILNYPMKTYPGSQFSYFTGGTSLLNALLITSTKIGLPTFADRFLFQPLGIKDVLWDDSSEGWAYIDGISCMLPRDMARIGLLMLQKGTWQGQQVIPLAWIEQSTRKHVSLAFNETWGNGYGYLWWLSEAPVGGAVVRSFAASGNGGQVIAIFPELQMVVVLTGGNNDENDKGQPFQIMEDFILPAVLSPYKRSLSQGGSLGENDAIGYWNDTRAPTTAKRRKAFIASFVLYCAS